MATTKKLHMITAVVQAHVGTKVINAALKAGAKGATYHHALGTGVRQTLGEAGEDIEIDKRVIFIVTETGKSDEVLRAVVETAELDKPGQGFACVQEIIRAFGIT